MNAPRKAPPTRNNLGVTTTTPVAFVSAGVLHLERMNAVSEEGAGILCPVVPMDGEEVPLCFRLSTHKEPLRCRARVEGAIPTTPGGLLLARTEGEKALHAATGSTGDSVTMMFRLSDLKPDTPSGARGATASGTALSERAPGEVHGGTLKKATGFCVRFVDPPADVKRALARHLQISRRLGEQLASHGGQLVRISEDDRAAIGNLFSEGQLSKRALDW
jgi:hypothetical protein